jgi:hypothetical protein
MVEVGIFSFSEEAIPVSLHGLKPHRSIDFIIHIGYPF